MSDHGMRHPLERIADVVAGGAGVTFSGLSIFDVIHGVEADLIGALVIFLLGLRIWAHIDDRRNRRPIGNPETPLQKS